VIRRELGQSHAWGKLIQNRKRKRLLDAGTTRSGGRHGLGGLVARLWACPWGLTLGPAIGRLIDEMMTGETPFCDPAPYGAERFIR
jgi:hypothetical protein